MKILLDTHIFLWAAMEPQKLSPSMRRFLIDPGTVRFLSIGSIWEISIKVSQGKLPGLTPASLKDWIDETMVDLNVLLLPVNSQHACAVAHFGAFPNRDPFDRLLAAQARLEGIPLLTVDTKMDCFELSGIILTPP